MNQGQQQNSQNPPTLQQAQPVPNVSPVQNQFNSTAQQLVPHAVPAQRNKMTEVLLPVNRSAWTIVGSYFALVSFPFIFLMHY